MKKETNQGLYLAFKIISVISFIAVIAISVLYFVESSKGEMSYFTKHFAIGLNLFLVGIIALIMPVLTNRSLQGENKGDHMMNIVGLLLLLCAAITIIFSYIR